MLRFVSKMLFFGGVLFAVAVTIASAQVGGGGSLDKPVASQLGGLVDANFFKKLPSTPIRKYKPAAGRATTKPATTAKAGKTRKTSPKTKPSSDVPAAPETISGLVFEPVANAGIDRELAATISENAAEQTQLIEVFRVSKLAYDQEVAKRGRQNDIAMALTFFIATCVTVYHDAPEPSEAALDNLYGSVADLMVQENSIVNSSNIDKQILHDRLIYISGLVLGGYTAAKQENDQASLATFRMLAGVCLKTLMQLEPDRLSFNQNGLVVN